MNGTRPREVAHAASNACDGRYSISNPQGASKHRQEAIHSTMPASDHQRTRLIPPTKWNDHHDWPPIGGLRHLIFHAKTNGFDAVVRRVGRRVLIDEDAFFSWVERTGSGK